MRKRSLGLAAIAAAVLFSPLGNVEACGPFFEPDVFVNTTKPDDLAAFATGKLGILQAGYDSNEYAVAFRYLNGGKLSAAELRAYLPLPPPSAPKEPDIDFNKLSADQLLLVSQQLAAAREAQRQAQLREQPPGRWLLARANYMPAAGPAAPSPNFPTDYAGNIVFDENYLNCPDDAFTRATLTLRSRAEAWGRQSSWLADWIHAQDAVFSNCDGKNVVIPAPAPSGSPALLKADRAYQVASATFYAKHFDDAAHRFTAIAADNSSPWSPWGQYLAARATLRKAFAMGKTTDPWSGDLASYDAATMQRAQQMLEALLAQPHPTPSRSIVQSELNFIRIRTETDDRAVEICAALAGPRSDANFAQDLRDLSWLLMKHLTGKSQAPLLAWIAAWRGSGTAATAYDEWQQSHALPWLVMALVKAGPSDAFAPSLIDAAAQIPPSSPAYGTVFFHRVRLLIALKRSDEARTLLDAALPPLRSQKPSSELNALLGERMAAARNFTEFLEFAPRNLLSTGSQAAGDLQEQCNEQAHSVRSLAPCPEVAQAPEFDHDAAQILNQQAPVTLLIHAAQTASLPQNMRRNLAIMAWARAVLLQDAKSGAALAPLLPKTIRDTAGSSVDFPADLAILRNPGIRPYLEAGVPRVASYSAFDEFRNNWWCKPWNDSGDSFQSPAKPAPLPVPSYIPPDQIAQGAAEYQRLQQLHDSASVIGQRVLDFANQHPGDPRVPEALALTVRATRYACQTWNPSSGTSGSQTEYTAVSKAAFELLHKRYPKSSWTLKTHYYY